MENPEAMARIFQSLAASTRIRLLCLLKDGVLSVGQIAEKLCVTQGAVSQHLRVLKGAGLVESQRHGYHVHYHVSGTALEQCRRALEYILQCQTPGPLPAEKARPRPRARAAHGVHR